MNKSKHDETIRREVCKRTIGEAQEQLLGRLFEAFGEFTDETGLVVVDIELGDKRMYKTRGGALNPGVKVTVELATFSR